MRMTLSEKGPIAPPPVLNGLLQGVSETIQSWNGVGAATHWHLYRPDQVDGTDFYVGDEELGHIHLDGSIHLATSLALRQALVTRGLAQPFPYAGYEGWVQSAIRGPADAELALWLFGLNHRRLCGTAEAALVADIAARS